MQAIHPQSIAERLDRRRSRSGARSGSLVLLSGSDATTIERISALLSQASYDVLVALDESQIERRAREFAPDLVIFAITDRSEATDGVCKHLSTNPRTAHIPLVAVLRHPPGAKDPLLDSLHDFVIAPFDPDEVKARVHMTLGASGRNRSLNPLTSLPGNPAIQRDLSRRIDEGEAVALMHIDIDDFKAFNDHYGFMRGDEAIKLLARSLTETLEELGATQAFAGHVGGDDFAAVVPADDAEAIGRALVDRWDRRIESLYDPEDVTKGYIEVPDRRGFLNRFPVMGLSVGIATTSTRPIRTHWEASQIAAEMKHVAKSQDSSTVAIDRRRESDPETEEDRAPDLVR